MLDKLLAALMFFTRLPFWRLRQPDAACFKHVVEYWPFAGWLTGGAMALAYMVLAMVLPPLVSALGAIGVRLLLTGALHEDGLADFCDGFGGASRKQVLEIMRDSHVGTYGVLGLVMYIAFLAALLASLPIAVAPFCIFTADVYAKCCAGFLIRQLPYARRAGEAKSGVVYAAWGRHEALLQLVRCGVALAPAALWLWVTEISFPFWALLLPPMVELFLARLMRRKIGGYTGDCCGATCLLCELSLYFPLVIFYH